jgi:hypothetical protein
VVVLKYGAVIWLGSVVILAGLLAYETAIARWRVRRLNRKNQPKELGSHCNEGDRIQPNLTGTENK